MLPYPIRLAITVLKPFTTADTRLQAEAICRMWMQTIIEESLELVAGGLEIEDKQHSLTFHYRNARGGAGIRTKVLNLLSRLSPAPNVLLGKLSVNVVPPWDAGKGTAVLSLTKHLLQDGLFYIGDEETDENVFALDNNIVMGVRVGRHKGSLSKFYLNYQAETENVLRLLITQLDEIRGS